jgi:hypothetical protein
VFVDVRPALLLMLAACASKESAIVTSSSATEQPAASTEPAPSAASASASASTAPLADPAVERAWQKVRAACAGGMFVSQPSFNPQLGGLASFEYYRFYENGVVVSASVAESEHGEDRAKTNAKVMRWLNADHHAASKGTYRIEGEKVVADLTFNARDDVRRSVEADFAKRPFVMKSVTRSNGHTETLKYACPL